MDALNHPHRHFHAPPSASAGSAARTRNARSFAGSEQHRDDTRREVERVALDLLDYCRRNAWAGYDPYDGLDSRWLQRPPLRDSRGLRVLVTQLNKYSPINLRPMLGIARSRNPKALGLCLAATVRLFRLGLLRSTDPIVELVRLIDAGRSAHPNASWGYSFPWQTRTQLVPKGHPNLVCTVFVANALLDAYELLGDERCLAMARGAAAFVGNELYRTTPAGEPSLAYPLPTSTAPVHNANLLGAALLVRIRRHGGSSEAFERGLGLARHAVSKQHADGSWSYGESSHWRWVDNFHTGFNLSALDAIARHGATHGFDAAVARGFDFYRRHFFLASGAPRYRANRTYPIDIHCVAQALITLTDLRHLDGSNLGMACRVYRWAAARMLDADGHFSYQAWPGYTVRIPYMRWSQAWMLLAMATLLCGLAPPDQQAVMPAEDLVDVD